MADYYSLLNNTIAKLASNTADNRAIVFGKARAAIDRKLRTLSPPPSEEAIARQMELLEDAIGRVEDEQTMLEHGGFATAEAASSPPPAYIPPHHDSPAPPIRQEPVHQAQPEELPAPEPLPHAYSTHEERSHPANADDMVSFDKPPVQTHDDHGYEGPGFDNQTYGEPVYEEPAYVGDRAEAETQTANRGNEDDFLPHWNNRLDGDKPAHVSAGDAGLMPPPLPEFRTRARKKNLTGKIIAFAIAIAIIAGGGYGIYAYQQSDPSTSLMQKLSNLVSMGGKNGAAGDGSEQAGNGDNGQAKDNVRLDDKGQSVEAPPAEGEENTADGPPVVIDKQNDAGAAPADGTKTPAETETAAEPAEPAQAPDASTVPVVADRAYLYTEATGGQGADLSNANVVWSLQQETPAGGGAAEATIHGELDVPDKGLRLAIDIKPNHEASLSASHVIELKFSVPPDFEGRNVDNVARFVMKNSEQARGEGLIAVPAKIMDGYFLIALDNLAKAQQVNKELLLNSSWIDIPLVYSTGVRALVTLEKGASGEKVFKEAFADWAKKG